MVSACDTVVVLLLAAGSSQRMGEKNKLLLPVDGEAMIVKALKVATRCSASSVYLLTGFERERVLFEARQFEHKEIHNPEFAVGQDKSLAVGLSALASFNVSVLVLLGDQPRVSAELLDELICAHCADGAKRALVPVYEDRKGTPRILPNSLVKRAAQADGRLSLRNLLSSFEEDVHFYRVMDPAVLHDIDTPEDYDQFTAY